MKYVTIKNSGRKWSVSVSAIEVVTDEGPHCSIMVAGKMYQTNRTFKDMMEILEEGGDAE